MWRSLLVISLLAGLACAASLGLPNELYNGGFEMGNLEGWRQGGDVNVYGGIGNIVPIEGYYMAGWTPYEPGESYLEQEVAPEVVDVPYEIDLSGYIWVLGPAQVQVVITIDGEPVASTDYIGPTEWWYYFELYAEGIPSCYKDVHILFSTTEGPYNVDETQQIVTPVVLIDGLDLEERIVPEPSTIALLLSGFAGIAAFMRKR